MERDRNESGQYADGIDPETVLDVVDAREDLGRPVTAGDVVDELGIARRTAHNKLGALVERGVLETRKIGARGRVWWRPIPADSVDTQPPRDARHSPETPVGDERDQSGGVAVDTPSTPDAGGEAATETLGDLDFPSGKDRDACSDAVHAARQYLKTERAATMREIVAAVHPDHALGYDVDAALAKVEAGERYRGAWWRRIVKPGLETFEDVEKPARGASEWQYTGDR